MSDVRNESAEPVIYTGWAPSIQSDEARDQTEKWLRSILDEPSAEYYDGAFDKPGSGGPMERLIWEINNLGGTVTCVSDQWVRVDTVGVVKGTQVETHIEADTFLLALAETFRWWREFLTAT
jgi:hypothetical protein